MKYRLLVWLCCVGTQLFAQEYGIDKIVSKYPNSFRQGTWLTGVQAGYSKAVFLERDLTIQLNGGYFVANKIVLGLQATSIHEQFKSVHDRAYLIGPMARYHFTRSRFSPFLTAAYQVGQRTVSGSESQQTVQTIQTSSGPVTNINGFRIEGSGSPERAYSRFFGAGASIGLIPPLWIELALTWQDKVRSADSRIRLDNGLYQLKVGLTYLLGTKH